ncbi:MAG: AMP-binding protein, partial [Parvibaculum sp.]
MSDEKIVIQKKTPFGTAPYLVNYAETYKNFSWEEARRRLDGLPDGGLNIAYEAVDRHVRHSNGNKVAIRWISKDESIRDISYAELAGETDDFANALKALNISKGDAVYALAGRVPELYIAALGTLKNGSVFCPLFSA